MFGFFRTISTAMIKCLLAVIAILGILAPNLAASASPGHKKIYLLRGLTNILSPGIDQLADELQKRNIDTTIANHAFSDALANEAIEGCKSGQFSSVVLVGHSLGARAAVSMAEQMHTAGLHVALIVTIDPVVKAVVPNNVRLLKNFYLSSGVGTTVERDGRFHGTLQNVDMGNTEYGHVSLTTAPAIQNEVIRDILAANSSCR